MKKKMIRKKKLKLKKNVIFMASLCFATLFMCVGYASYNSIIMDINSTVAYKSNKEILIVDAKYLNSTNADISNSTINSYYQTTLDSNVYLTTDHNSSITYEIHVRNNTDYKYMFDGVKFIDSMEFYSNKNIDFTLDNLNINDIVYPNETRVFTITFKYKDVNNITNNQLISKLNFKFRKVFKVEYQNIEIQNNYPEYAYDDEPFILGFANSYETVSVEENDIFLDNDNYEYSNNNLNIPSVNGDLIIRNLNDVYLSSYVKKLYKDSTKSDVTTGSGEVIKQDKTNKLQMDSYNNIRYYGENPNNYIMFDNNLWRIIGVFDDIVNEKGKTETRVKIMKDSSIGRYSFSYNEFDYFGGSNYFVNSDMNNTLNLYLNKQSGNCLFVSEYVPCDFTSSGLSEEAKKLIGPAKYYLGAINMDEDMYYADQIYNLERTNPNFICNNGEPFCPRLPSFSTTLALMYPSDYLYAVDFNECDMYNMMGENCLDNNYIADMNISDEYTLNASPEYDTYVSGIYHNWEGMLYYFLTSQDAEIRPVAYLNSDVTYVIGTGTINNPYKIDTASKHSISYENINIRKGYPREAFDKENLLINFYDEIPTSIKVYQDDVLLTSGYTFNNNSLRINSITGNIRIEVLSKN